MVFLKLTACMLVILGGQLSLGAFLYRLPKREYVMLNAGFFFLIYGLSWLTEFPSVINTLALQPAMPYLQSVLTYLMPIPFTAFLMNVVGRGLFNSLWWTFLSTIVYAIGAMIWDRFSATGPLSPSILPVVVALWCFAGGINLVFIRNREKTEMTLMQVAFAFMLLALTNDNLVVLNLLPWKFRLAHIDILVLMGFMGWIAVRRLMKKVTG
jgi:hypothetical protein